MKTKLFHFLCAVMAFITAAPLARAEVFSSEPQIFNADEEATIRGVVNVVDLPVPDQVEVGPTQSGYFLFTSYPCTIKAKDIDDKSLMVTNQTMFQLAPSADQVKLLKTLLGKPVEMHVSMMPAETRYHRTAIILIKMKSIKPINTAKSVETTH